jgi:hypothetical protein
MGLFDGIIGAEAPVSNMDDSMTPPLIIPTDTGDGDSLIIHDESVIGSPVVSKGIIDFDISMPEIVTKNPETTDIKPEISLIDEANSEVQPASDTIHTESVIEMSPISLSDTNNSATLEDRIAGFVADLERLKADDEMILHEKESAIEKLETEMKELTREIKKIQADEKRIDATIASINTPITKTK